MTRTSSRVQGWREGLIVAVIVLLVIMMVESLQGCIRPPERNLVLRGQITYVDSVTLVTDRRLEVKLDPGPEPIPTFGGTFQIFAPASGNYLVRISGSGGERYPAVPILINRRETNAIFVIPIEVPAELIGGQRAEKKEGIEIRVLLARPNQ